MEEKLGSEAPKWIHLHDEEADFSILKLPETTKWSEMRAPNIISMKKLGWDGPK